MARDTLSRETELKELGYDYEWSHSNFIVANYLRVAPYKNRWCYVGEENKWYDFKDMSEIKDELDEWFNEDTKHLGCFGYPFCDENPLGCSVRMGDAVEQFGHKG
tara:strand:- start:3452 stop:3766 length:315 start_codon:yes stop_codon:yes gene_type:complete